MTNPDERLALAEELQAGLDAEMLGRNGAIDLGRLQAAIDFLRSPSSETSATTREALKPFAEAWTAYGDKPDDATRLADNKGAAYLEACMLTFGDLRRAHEVIAQKAEPEKSENENR